MGHKSTEQRGQRLSLQLQQTEHTELRSPSEAIMPTAYEISALWPMYKD